MTDRRQTASSLRRRRLLQGASAVAFAMALRDPAAHAQLVALRAAAHLPANGAGAPAIAVPTVPGLSTGNTAATAALNRQLSNAVKAQQAVNLALQAQSAARTAAAALTSSVPNGLAVGGLQPVANPVLAANDPTGLKTWQGANLPTQAVASNGAVTVNIQQTAAQAVLDWTTFNVGANTTLNFDQSQNGTAQPNWVALNRVVGQLDPTTGLRNPNLAPAPSQILGAIKSQGTVLVINQNGILFSATAQINTNSLIATSLEIGAVTSKGALLPSTTTQTYDAQGNLLNTATGIAAADTVFLQDGLLQGAVQNGSSITITEGELAAQQVTMVKNNSDGTLTSTTAPDASLEGAITVEAGAQITSGTGGFVLLAAPKVTNAGVLSSAQGEVALASGRQITLLPSSGDGSTGNVNVRGLVVGARDAVGSQATVSFTSDYVQNTATGLIQAPDGYAALVASGAAINAGTITATTSTSRNGFIEVSAQNVQLAPASTLSITADNNGTIPQDPTSLADFKPSLIEIGQVYVNSSTAAQALPIYNSSIDVGANSLVYAPSANVYVGATPGAPTLVSGSLAAEPSRLFVDTGAVIDASGLKDVQVPLSQVLVTISPVTTNDTADTPADRALLNHATVTLDTRLSGVRSDGTAWVGSPLIPAANFAQQIGVNASQLMTKGGNVVLGTAALAAGSTTGVTQAPDVIVKSGANVDVSGGWVTYGAGQVQTTELIDASGHIVPIGQADPNDTYVGIYKGFTATEPSYGLSQTYSNPLLSGAYYQSAYTQGGDAGSLTVKTSQPTLEGTIYADAFAGPFQLQGGQAGTATSSVYGDLRSLQAVSSQLPAGGMLLIQETSSGTSSAALSGGDIDITAAAAADSTAGLSYGQTVSVDSAGVLTVPTARSADSLVPASERATLTLSTPALSAMGLGQLSFDTSGGLTLEAGANLTLAAGGVFSATTGRTITIAGDLTAPSGTINLQTVDVGQGSIFAAAAAPEAGAFDIVVNGQLSTAGLWTNDYGLSFADAQGPGYVNGGSISLSVEPRVDSSGFNAGGGGQGDIATVAQTQAGTAPVSSTDISGSILIDGPTSLLNVSAGGYVAPDGTLTLTAKGGNVSLYDPTAYFPFEFGVAAGTALSRATGAIPGFRVNGIANNPAQPGGSFDLAVNPASITSVVAIGANAIQAAGFSGGTFSLTTPAISLGDGIATTGTELPLNFFSTAGFGTYNITSYATDLVPNTFNNGFGGYNAVLATQVLTVQSGQTLNLTQANYSNHLTGDQIAALRSLPTGGQLSSVLTPVIQPDGYDQKAVTLDLGGLIEFEVAAGGQVTGAAGASLTASQINNLGTIRLPGGTLAQSETLPQLYVAGQQDANGDILASGVVASSSLNQIFSVNPDGSITEGAPSLANPKLTNAQLAVNDAIFLTGDLPANVGVRLAPGSVTDLSGESLRNPYAPAMPGGSQVATGTLVAGGTVRTAAPNLNSQTTQLFSVSAFDTANVAYSLASTTVVNPSPAGPGLGFVAASGSTLNLSGAADTYDQLTAGGTYVASPQWSSGGALSLGAGGTFAGADILATGGAPSAAGGTLTLSTGGSTPVSLAATDPASPAANVFSASQIQGSGFGTMVVQGDLATSGTAPVDLTLGQAFVLTGLQTGTIQNFILTSTSASSQGINGLDPVVSAAGTLQINAPYVSLQGAYQALPSPTNAADNATVGTGSVTFTAQALDVTGAVLFDQAVANVALQSSGDLRFIGVEPLQVGGAAVSPSLAGQLAVNGNLNLAAGQVYATTGTSFAVTSAGKAGVIAVSALGATPATPYSAGSNLVLQAASIVQDGVVRAPIGALTLGGAAPLTQTISGVGAVTFAPATTSLTLGAGSVTSVSADGLSIPYGTTTDQTEYYFTPNNANPLTAPPAAVLTLVGQTVSTAAGATIDLTGGGDLYAYEFVPGSGGSHDVLSQFNTDTYTSNGGYQYPDGRQVYAIVPGLSSAPVAASDPVYSANYGALYGSSQIGQRVYLDGGSGVAAGWYTLLPAQYATLPGGMEVVEDTSAKTVVQGASTVLPDGTVTVTGQFGGLGGTVQSAQHVFDVKSQTVINAASNIVLTSADTYFAKQAASSGQTAARLPIDAGRLILQPGGALTLGGTFATTPATGGRGSEADVTGAAIAIVDQVAAVMPGVLQLSAAQLDDLNASSLLIGGVRSDNADGTTSLNVTAHQITVGNDATHPLSAPDIVLAVDGSASSLTLLDGAALVASGADTTGQTGAYVLNGSTPGMTAQGALVRVSAGPQRDATRQNVLVSAGPGVLTVGAATLSGASILLDSSGGVSLSPLAALTANSLGLDASSIAFAPSGQGLSGLVITPTLLTALGGAQALALRSPGVIGFAAGSYGFGSLTLDAPGVAVTGGSGSVAVSGQAVVLENGFADAGGCTVGGALACGGGQFALSAQSLTFGDGEFRVYGAGQGVSLSAPQGVAFQGQGGLDVGAAPLTIQTAFLGDQLAPGGKIGVATKLPSLALTTTGALTIANATGAAAATVAGVPGASLTLDGSDISVTGADVRATAGVLTLAAAGNIAVGPGATLETPGYAKSFGDAADPYSVSAPGGRLSLTATSGNINLAQGSTVSVGGGSGAAGSLSLSAAQGAVAFGGTINGAAPNGGAGFTLNEAGAFDLTSFLQAAQGAFSGDVSIAAGAGNLTLASGLTLKAADVSLTANSGLVDIAGTIDVSGVNGGKVGLFGTGGVTLEGGALVAARASGYGASDTRQASGGDVQLGTSGSGAITVASGAGIDVSAANTTGRLVQVVKNGVTDYTYVAPDQGGTVSFRAPVSGGDSAETLNVGVAGVVTGASSIVLEGYKAYDLGAIAKSGQFTGVTVDPATGVTLNTATAGTTGRPNFLADNAPGTLVDYIQTFNVSADYANLGGLASQANFHARPGVELDYSGGVTLASNWNLGAGTVNVAGAVAAGLMVADPAIPGAYAIVPGDEAAVFANYTKLTYRVGGTVLGEPGVLTLKAGGQLNINGSITDGFFTFADQTDQRYINTLIGGSPKVYGTVGAGCSGSCSAVPVFSPQTTSGNYISVGFPSSGSLGTLAGAAPANLIPYDAVANSPAALSTGTQGGDPIGSAEMFPLVQTSAGTTSVNSWSYQLTGGAAVGSANPSQVVAGVKGGVTVQGRSTYTYGGAAARPTNTVSNTLYFTVNGQQVTASQLVAAEEAASPNLTGSSLFKLSLGTAPTGTTRTQLETLAAAYFSKYPGQYVFTGPATAPTGVTTTLALAAGYLQQVSALWASLNSGYTAPAAPMPQSGTAQVATLIRTGTGSISLAAAGDINLQNNNPQTGAPTYLNPSSGAPASASTGAQQGGVAIYTAGALVAPSVVTAVDSTNGQLVTLDPSAYATVIDNVGGINYGYGVAAGASGSKGLQGVLVSNPVYAQGGGDITLQAGGDVLGRRDEYTATRLIAADAGGAPNIISLNFIGTSDQPWRMGTVGADTNILVNPQLFTEGLGTLGGGDVSVTAGGGVSDLSMVADTTVTTAKASGPGVPAGQTNLGLLTYGGGDVTVVTGANLLGGRIDVGSGSAHITVGGAVTGAGQAVAATNLFSPTTIPNTLRLRLTDATVDLTAHQGVEIEGIAALGVQKPLPGSNTTSASTSNADALGFYSANAGVSITTDGSVSIDNPSRGGGSDVVAHGIPTNNVDVAILPGSLQAVSLEGALNLAGGAQISLLTPTATGTLTLAAGADIAPVDLAMLDNDPGLTPGLFSTFITDDSAVGAGIPFVFPAVLPTTSQVTLEQYHSSLIPHRNDTVPNRIYAGGDINNVILSAPKQTRIGAGQDIVNMVFFGQNLNPSDITRIVAGRDITATTLLQQAETSITFANSHTQIQYSAALPTVQGDTFVLGGPGSLMLQAGRNIGPFLTSATVNVETNNPADINNGLQQSVSSYAGGVLTVGNAWNPWLAAQGASISLQFGVAHGENFSALTNYYLNPANISALPDYLFPETLNAQNVYVADRSQTIYQPKLIAWMQANQASALKSAFGTTNVTYAQAYQAFSALPPLQQQPFLLQVYFNELSLTSTPGPTLNNYTRGYTAVNLLFPSSLGYTANNLGGGTNGANTQVHTGNLDLRLATVETQYGGDINILGPGGQVLAGSTVATAQQAARRNSAAVQLYYGGVISAENGSSLKPYSPSTIASIPAGYEGVLTLRGGAISSFTDASFILNQSRLFTEEGGNIIMWSSNGDLNAGEGPKTSSNFPPVVVQVDSDAYSQLNQASSVTGAGIGAFQPSPDITAPNVYLIAPRGTVDAGAAGVRFSGDLFVAALHVANADNFTNVGSGIAIGLPPASTVANVSSTASNAGNAATKQAQEAVAATAAAGQDRSIITVEVLGFGDQTCVDLKHCPPASSR